MASPSARPASRTAPSTSSVMSTKSTGLLVSTMRTRRATIAVLTTTGMALPLRAARVDSRSGTEHLVPRYAGGHLHQHEERHNGAHGDCEAREALEEEGVT